MWDKEHTQRAAELAESRARHWSSTQHAGELHLDIIATYQLSVVHDIHTAEIGTADMNSAHIDV